MQLVRGRGAAGDEGLEHAAHNHRLHVLGHRLVVPRGEVVPEARLVWKQEGGTTNHTGGGSGRRGEDITELSDLSGKNTEPVQQVGEGGGKGKGVHTAYGGEAN